MPRLARKHVILVACMLLATFLWTVLLPQQAQASEANVARVRVFQEYKVDVSGLPNTFEYQVIPNEEDAPVPTNDTGATLMTFSLTRDQDMWLEFPVTPRTSPAAEHLVYHYTLKPTKTELEDGLYYVDLQSENLEPGVNEYYLEIHVQLSNEDESAMIVAPIVHIEGWDGPKVTDPGWRIAHKETEQEDKDKEDEQQEEVEKEKSSTRKTDGQTSQSGSGSSSKSEPATTTTSARTASLATTADTLDYTLVAACPVIGLSLLLLGAAVRRTKAGDGHA